MSNDKPHYHGHRERLRKRFLSDSTALSDYEILELLLGKTILRADTKDLAKTLLKEFGSLRGIFTAYPEELLKIKGLGQSTLSFFNLLREFMIRYEESAMRERDFLCTPQAVAKIAKVRLGALHSEEVWAAYLNNSNRLISWERLQIGTVSAVKVYVREVLEKALRYKATGFIIVHNHPGGSLFFSGADLEFTQHLQRAAKDLDIRLVDHLVITEQGCYSYVEDTLL